MEFKRHIVWSKEVIDLTDSFQRAWYIKQVLSLGREEDVASLDWNEIRALLKTLGLPAEVRSIWEKYFRAHG